MIQKLLMLSADFLACFTDRVVKIVEVPETDACNVVTESYMSSNIRPTAEPAIPAAVKKSNFDYSRLGLPSGAKRGNMA